MSCTDRCTTSNRAMLGILGCLGKGNSRSASEGTRVAGRRKGRRVALGSSEGIERQEKRAAKKKLKKLAMRCSCCGKELRRGGGLTTPNYLQLPHPDACNGEIVWVVFSI